MTFNEARRYGDEFLKASGVDNSSAESLWMLQAASGKTGSELLLHSSDELKSEEEEKFKEMLSERAGSRPVQYVLGKWDFYGGEFKVGEGALIPRPETEGLVEIASGLLKEVKNPVIIDLCAGTGCIGLTLARLFPSSRVYLVEKYDEALSFLSENALGLPNAEIIKGDIFSDEDIGRLPVCDLLVSNPPYVKSSEIPSLAPEVLREPREALDGGDDGLDFYRRLSQIIPSLCKGAYALECGDGQGKDIEKILPGSKTLKDLSGLDRYVVKETSGC